LNRLELNPVLDEKGVRRIYEWRDLPADPIGKLDAIARKEAEEMRTRAYNQEPSAKACGKRNVLEGGDE